MCVKACVYIHAMENSGGVAVGGAYAKSNISQTCKRFCVNVGHELKIG